MVKMIGGTRSFISSDKEQFVSFCLPNMLTYIRFVKNVCVRQKFVQLLFNLHNQLCSLIHECSC